MLCRIGSGVRKIDTIREILSGFTKITNAGPKRFQIATCNGGVEAQQISLRRYLNHQLYSGAHRLEMCNVCFRRMLFRISMVVKLDKDADK